MHTHFADVKLSTATVTTVTVCHHKALLVIGAAALPVPMALWLMGYLLTFPTQKCQTKQIVTQLCLFT